MRILIGTLHTSENEYAECLASVREQSHDQFEQIVIEGLPNRDAHQHLYETFMAKEDDFDLFMKLDADMVIEDPHLFEKIVHKFKIRPNMQQLTIPVIDFFTDGPIFGLHTFRSGVKWVQSNELLFTDHSPVSNNERVVDHLEFTGTVTHCKNPSGFQAFHYGIHRGLKVRDGNLDNRYNQIHDHWLNLENIRQNFLRGKDRRVGLALLGAELALAGEFAATNLNYRDSYAATVYRRYEIYSDTQLARTIGRIRSNNWGWLPAAIRFDVLKHVPHRDIAVRHLLPRALKRWARKLLRTPVV